jgi:hypothetical protein
MTSEENRRALEQPWASPTSEESTLESPSWHGDVLENTVGRYKAGEEQPLDWVEAKRLLRKRAE